MRKAVTAALTFAALMLLAGCADRTELGERAIIQAAALNADEHGYTVNALLFSSSESGLVDASEENVIRVEGSGATLAQALDDVSVNDGRAAYLSDIKLVIFGGGFEDADITEALNTLYFDMECGLNTVLACADDAFEVIELRFTEGVTSAEKLLSLIENANREGISPKTTLLDALCAAESGSAVLLPQLVIEENGSVTSQDDGLTAVPSGSRLVSGGRLGRRCTAEETVGLMLVSGETHRLTLSFDSGGKDRVCEARSIRVRLLPDGSAQVSASFRAKNGAALAPRDEQGAMERLRELVMAAL